VQAGHLGAPSNHLAAFSGVPVLASDGAPVGTLMLVLTGAADTLDGIVIEAQVGGGGARFVDAAGVDAFYERGVTLTLDREACADLPRPQPPPPLSDASSPLATGLEAKLRRAWELLAGGR
jgi:hypothetical protein